MTIYIYENLKDGITKAFLTREDAINQMKKDTSNRNLSEHDLEEDDYTGNVSYIHDSSYSFTPFETENDLTVGDTVYGIVYDDGIITEIYEGTKEDMFEYLNEEDLDYDSIVELIVEANNESHVSEIIKNDHDDVQAEINSLTESLKTANDYEKQSIKRKILILREKLKKANDENDIFWNEMFNSFKDTLDTKMKLKKDAENKLELMQKTLEKTTHRNHRAKIKQEIKLLVEIINEVNDWKNETLQIIQDIKLLKSIKDA